MVEIKKRSMIRSGGFNIYDCEPVRVNHSCTADNAAKIGFGKKRTARTMCDNEYVSGGLTHARRPDPGVRE